MRLDVPAGEPLRVLCLGAHCDDIEIGCGGTVQHLIARPGGIVCRWCVFSSTPEREREARAAAGDLLQGVVGSTVEIHAYRESYFPYVGDQIKDRFEEIRREFEPDLVLTHYRHDRHQDHRVLSDLTWNTFRDHLILEYEIPKWDGDLGTPNVFVPLEEEQARRKVRVVLDRFASQRTKAWFDEEAFLGLLRIRGLECNASSRYAEAFYVRKAVL